MPPCITGSFNDIVAVEINLVTVWLTGAKHQILARKMTTRLLNFVDERELGS